jgi:hypothetical protein
VPTIIYGYFALLFVTPLLQKHLPRAARLQHALGRPGDGHHDRPLCEFAVGRRDARGADEHARSVVRDGRDAPADGAFVVTPAALSGIASSYILGISRAVGETMVVAIAAGMQPNFTFNPIEPAATITAYIVQVALGDLPHGSIGYQTIFAAGLMLLLITLLFNMLGHSCASTFVRPTENDPLPAPTAADPARPPARRMRRADSPTQAWDWLFGCSGVGPDGRHAGLCGALRPDAEERLPHPERGTSSPASRRGGPASAGILSAWVGSILVMLVTALFAVPLGIGGASTSKSTRRRTGSPTSSRSTSPTWPACRRSSTACWRWACSSTPSASARASCPPA